MNTKVAGTATSASAEGSTDTKPEGSAQTNETPELTINSAQDITTQVEKLRTSDAASGRAFTLDGFKNLTCLKGMKTGPLAVMAGAIIRQIVVNGDNKKVLGALNAYGQQVGKEIELESRLDSYRTVAADLGITRNADESAADFIKRVQSGLAKK